MTGPDLMQYSAGHYPSYLSIMDRLLLLTYSKRFDKEGRFVYYLNTKGNLGHCQISSCKLKVLLFLNVMFIHFPFSLGKR